MICKGDYGRIRWLASLIHKCVYFVLSGNVDKATYIAVGAVAEFHGKFERIYPMVR